MRHTVEDISFAGGWLECACGAMVADCNTPAALDTAFRAHRATAGLRTDASNLKAPRGLAFTIVARHQREHPRRPDPMVGYLLSMHPLT